MVTPILSSVPVCRVRFIRTRNNLALATQGLKATPTLARLNVPSQHGFIDLETVSSQVDPDTGIGYMDLVVTGDPQVAENFGWVITGDGWTGFSRTVSIPQSGVGVDTVYSDSVEMPAVWLNELADFTGASGPVGSQLATRTYVDDSVALLQSTPDPFPQYRLDSEGSGGASGGAGGVLSGSYPNPGFAVNMATQDELDAAIATSGFRARASRVAFLGDSITVFNSTDDTNTGFENVRDNFGIFSTILSGGRLQFGHAYGTGGYTLSQIRDTVLPRLLAAPADSRSGSVVVLGGTNDVGVGDSYSPSVSIGALNTICQTLIAQGITPLCATIPPREDGPAANRAASLHNAAVAQYARKRGYKLVDFHAALVDPLTGGFKTGHQIGDGVHPSPQGMMAMAQALVDAGWIGTVPTVAPQLVRYQGDTSDLNGGKGLFLGDSNSDGRADDWNAGTYGGTATYSTSIVAPSSGDTVGKWQRLTRSVAGETGLAYLVRTVPVTGISVGDLLGIDVRVRITGASDAYPAAGGPAIHVDLLDDSFGSHGAVDFATSRDITGIVHLERRFTAGTTQLALYVQVPGHAAGTVQVDVGQYTVRNMTALAVVA